MIIASVHSNLKMDQDRAMLRSAQGRGKPGHHHARTPDGKAAPVKGGVPDRSRQTPGRLRGQRGRVEINANPLRLDLDWTWVRYALDKGITISINPDAHSTKGIGDIRYGVLAARKAGMTAEECLNTRPLHEFSAFLAKKQ
jgi:DNA polymerase (family X)